MKSIKQYIITEKLRISKDRNSQYIEYKYFPENIEELIDILTERTNKEGNEADLNDIDVSNITTMENLFFYMTKFNGDITKWDVSNVTNMDCMFEGAKSFNRDISKWDVSNVTNYTDIFSNCFLDDKFKPKFN